MHGPSTEKRPVAGAVAVLVAVSIWGGMAVVIRLVDQVDGLVLGFHRLWIGAIATILAFGVFLFVSLRRERAESHRTAAAANRT